MLSRGASAGFGAQGGRRGEQEEEEEMAVMDAPSLLLVCPRVAHSLGEQLHLFGPRGPLMLPPRLVCAGKQIRP